jgi:alkanesulfonate monooxygenase SsuD/methylene tetrahydromethanopterin reductase-like flavin-dependent oxidoreductase (luciferase family)
MCSAPWRASKSWTDWPAEYPRREASRPKEEGIAVKFGVFYELQLPKPWQPDDEFELIQNALEQVELADGLGYDYAWEVEHHFLEEYSHSSAPEVFLAAASQRTKNIRLGHGIVQLPTNHPARVVERVSTLDLISGGRVEFGVGEGSSITELHPFDRRFRDKRVVWEDAMRCIMPMFWNEGWEYHGEYFDFPLRNVIPKPRQKPHPPLWVACSQLETIMMAGERGIGALGFQFVSAEAAHAWVNAYYNAFTKRQQKLADYATNPNIAVVSQFMCAATDEEARARADGSTFFQFALRFYNTHGPVEPGTTSLWDEYQEWKQSPKGQAAQHGGLIGSPETIRRKLRKFESTNVDQVILLNQAGRNRHDHICEALEMFAREIMPEFHDNEDAHQQWKRGVLEGRIELEEIDTTPYDLPSNQTPASKAKEKQAAASAGD